ncbi:MAG TPA: TonB family protein [Thermoanaerobaculia bacterium]|nr:TonB family protein [Thermoanaerobaculia bacterium]
MFDTSVVRARAVAAPRSATLLVSIAIHSIAVVAAVALTLTSTRIPADAPKQMELYRPVEVPSPPPAPLGVRPSVAPPPSAAQTLPTTQVAPAQIPDALPAATQSASTSLSLGPATDNEPGPIGDRDGVPGAGTATVAEHGPYTPGVAGVTSARVLTKVEPQFPNALRGAVTSTTVVVRCIIGKDGRIHDPEIVKSSFTPFNDAVLTALRQWTFEPGRNNGQPVDTYFQLTVNFEVRR